mmetsp:Transcript_35221/g.99301  ORF Transcript_35221/g.99301 Transcript_35221/m.99301 type:complete len:203 (+) Transcript_35221:1101-1709(+)
MGRSGSRCTCRSSIRTRPTRTCLRWRSAPRPQRPPPPPEPRPALARPLRWGEGSLLGTPAAARSPGSRPRLRGVRGAQGWPPASSPEERRSSGGGGGPAAARLGAAGCTGQPPRGRPGSRTRSPWARTSRGPSSPPLPSQSHGQRTGAPARAPLRREGWRPSAPPRGPHGRTRRQSRCCTLSSTAGCTGGIAYACGRRKGCE